MTDKKTEALLALAQRIEEADGELISIDVKAAAALREVLAEQPAHQEPVAWVCRRKTGGSLFVYTEEQLSELGYGNISVPAFDKIAPLYTAPPQRTWVGLTDGEAFRILSDKTTDWMEKWSAIEAKLKEKNT